MAYKAGCCPDISCFDLHRLLHNTAHLTPAHNNPIKGWLLRMRYNPFYADLETRVINSSRMPGYRTWAHKTAK